jgi:hypothetical protein
VAHIACDRDNLDGERQPKILRNWHSLCLVDRPSHGANGS